MARPRKSATILALNGTFDHNPARIRADLEGAGPFNALPPAHFMERDTKGNLKRAPHVDAWNHIVERLPKTALSSSDEVLVEVAARLYCRFRRCDDDTEEFRRLSASLMNALAALGMTPTVRAKIGSSGKQSTQKNRFGELKEQA